MNITVQYRPGDPDPWSQAPGKQIHVGQGSTTLNWAIQVIPASAGSIVFNTATNTPGIQFTGTGNSTYPGTPPSRNATQWTSTITNNLPPGGSAPPYHYKVNAIYTPQGGTATNVTYDPDVVEDPPAIVIG